MTSYPRSELKIFLCLFVSVRFISSRWVLCVSDVLTAPASELRFCSDRRHRLHRLVPMAVRKGWCWSMLSASVIVCTLLAKGRANYAYLGYWGYWGFYSSRGWTSFPWFRSLPYKSPYERILRNPFLVRVFLYVGHKIFPCICMRGGQV